MKTENTTFANVSSIFRHPLGTRAKILLASVFGPYAQDDEYGSRTINPMELYHNQVTRVQGPFSLRIFHRSWGLMFLQANVSAPCTLLDFPTLERFIDELQRESYDVIGISGITCNVLKVKKMCELIRQYQPQAQIVVGGHVANIPDLAERIDADHIVRGEGIRWFRSYLGEDPQQPIRHPLIPTRIGTRTMGIPISEKPGETAATVVPSVGCPMGCNFCATSAMFGGKGKFYSFYRTGDELFDVLLQLEREMKAKSFFIMDENFLLDRRRALRLLELMKQHDKSWIFYVFSSAGVIRSYTMEQLVELGVSWVWMGLEGENSQYDKLNGINTHELIRNLQAHGIRVLGSTIIGLENHTPENIDAAIDYAVRHDTDFHQFMLYTPIPGTPFYRAMEEEGVLISEDELSLPDVHGQYRFNYRHWHIPAGQETGILLRAFERDFEINGPSMSRIVRTMLTGWQRYKNHPDPRVRRRFLWDNEGLATAYTATVAAARLYYRNQPALFEKMDRLLKDLIREFGWKARFFALAGGPYVLHKIRREEKRLAAGWTIEPPAFYDKNEPAMELTTPHSPSAALARSVAARVMDEVLPPKKRRRRKQLERV
jgi:pyruvate-formate lyase-activating enzyme